MPLKTIIIQVASLLVYLLLGWVLIHFIAVFGIFLALALPILHLFFYPRILCFWCQIKHSPHTLSHSLIDASLLLSLSFLSIGVVYGETQILRIAGFSAANKTASFIIPGKSEYLLGEIFSLKIELDGIEKPINVIQADLKYDTNMVEAKAVTTQGSFATLFLQKDINPSLGYIHITGGLPNPGYIADHKSLFATVYFKGLKPGITSISYLPSSLALSNDGNGSNILKSFGTVNYLIRPEPISAEELKIQEDMLIQEQVSGEKISTQLTFYDSKLALGNDNTGEILGENTELKGSIPSSPWHWIFEKLSEIDEKILSIWKKMLGR